MERGLTLHFERRTLVMSQHKHVCVIGRIVSPPTLPAQIRPRAPNRAEHVAAHDPGANIPESPCSKLFIGTSRVPTILSVHSLKRSCCPCPFVQGFTAKTK